MSAVQTPAAPDDDVVTSPPAQQPTPPWVFLLVTTAAAFVVRIAYCLTIAADTVGAGDAHYYHWQANLLARGRGFIDPYFLHDGVVAQSANHPPGWQTFLSLFSHLGLTTYAEHRAIGALTGAVAVLLVGILAFRIGGVAIAKVAVVVAAVNPVMIGVDGSLLSESLYGIFVLAAVLVALRVAERPSAVRLAVLGVFIGLAALTRSEGLALVLLLGLPAVWKGGGRYVMRAARLAVVGLACLAVVSPWVIRNYDVFGRVVFSTNDGSLLVGANCPATYSGELVGAWSYQCLTPFLHTDEATQSEIWRDKAFRYMGNHADRLPAVIGVRILRTWGLYRVQTAFDEGVPAGFSRFATYFQWLSLPLIVYGVVVGWRRRATLWPFASLAILVTVTSAAGWGTTRFRHAFELVSCVLIAFALHDLATRVAARRAVSPRTGT